MHFGERRELGTFRQQTRFVWWSTLALFRRTSQVAKVVIFLASEDAAMVTGSSYSIDGGVSISA